MSRQLRTLLKQNRILEEKIFHPADAPEGQAAFITSEELSKALTNLSQQIKTSQDKELSVLKMLNDVEEIRQRPLPSYEKSAVQVVEIMFNYLREYSQFDQQYYHLLNSLQLAFTRLSLNDLSFLDNPKHIAVKFLEKLLKLGQHFDQNAGKLAKFFVHAVELLTDKLASKQEITSKTFISANKKLEEYFDSFNEKATMNINRIFNDIEKTSRAEQADKNTQSLIKSKTDGEEVPIILLNFFNDHLYKVLHQTIKLYGTQSKQCQQVLTDMDTLTWSITHPLSDEEYRQRFESDVSEAMKRLYELFNEYQCLNQDTMDFFAEAENIHTQKLAGNRVDYDVMISCDIFDDELFEDEVDPDAWMHETTKNNLFDISSLREGDWYQITQQDQVMRCRLLLISELTKEIYFINLSGEMVLKVSFVDTEFLSNHLKNVQIDEQITYKHATKALIRELNSRLEILKVEYQNYLKQKAKDALIRQEQEEMARQIIKKRIEEDKRRQALLRQQELRAEAERKEKERLAEEAQAKKRFQAKAIYRKLTPGAMIAYKTDSGQWTEATLTLISKTTQRHIFSDNKGNNVLEPKKEELMALISEGRFKILSQARSSADAMQSLVKQRRQKLDLQ